MEQTESKRCTECGKECRYSQCSGTCRAKAIEQSNREHIEKDTGVRLCSECDKPIGVVRLLANPRSIVCSHKCKKDRAARLGRERKRKKYVESDMIVHKQARGTANLQKFLCMK